MAPIAAKIALLGSILFYSSSGFGEDLQHVIRFGPFIGGGSTSTSAEVRHGSGFSLEGDQLWKVSSKWQVGPHLSFTNSFISTKNHTEETAVGLAGTTPKSFGVYDSRAFAAGVASTYAPSQYENGHLFATAAGGKVYSKLSYDESSEDFFLQSSFHNIEGNYGTAQLGGYLPLRESFGLVLSIHGQWLQLDQSSIKGTYSGERLLDGNSLSLTGSYQNPPLDDEVVIRSYNIRLGLSVSI